jgi:uncharacterized membrane protein YbaN (DUF454 family)
MEWITPEYTHYEKGRDWYVAVLIVAIGFVVAEAVLGEVILIVVTILATIAFLLLSIRKPQDLHVVLEQGGIRIGDVYHPFSLLQHFAVVESVSEYKIILESTKRFSPYMIVPLAPDIDPEEVRLFLSQKLEEADLREPLSHIIFERLGF